MERITSPEKLNDYIQVSNPSSWMVLGIALALVIGLLVWGVCGRLEESVSFQGQAKDGVLQCFVSGDVSAALASGMEASVTPLASSAEASRLKGTVASVADYPISYEEASREVASDYMLSALGITGWNVMVTIQTEEPLYEGVVYQVSVVTQTNRPIDLVFR